MNTRRSSTERAVSNEGLEGETERRPGAIQPFGAMLVLDQALSRILHVSANSGQMLGFDAERAGLAQPEQILGTVLLDELQEGLRERQRLSSALTDIRTVQGQSLRFFVTAFRDGDRVVIEFEPLIRQSGRRLLSMVSGWLARIGEAQTIPLLLDALVRGTRDLTDHDRVMVYEFDGEWNGRVVAESVAEETEALLGRFFPAADVPLPVRRLYEINPVLSIPDREASPVPIQPPPDPPLDISRGLLRAPPASLVASLRGMGVSASLSVAMQGDGGLWGLLTCHGLRPHPLSPIVRDAVHTLAQMATQRMFLLRARMDARYLQQVLDSRDLLSEERGQLRSPEELLRRHGGEWLELFRGCGAALLYRDQSAISTVGDVPGLPVLRAIAGWLSRHHGKKITWDSAALGLSDMAELGIPARIAGLMAVQLRIERSVSGWLLLFRHEQVQQRQWGRRPVDLLVTSDQSGAQSARDGGFGSWLEEVRGQSERWRGIERRAAIDLGEDLAVAISAHEIGELNARLLEANERLELLAHTDPLTQVWNRYRIEQAIDAEFSVAARYGRPSAILLFDVDNFKRVNDTHGHDVGDQVLRRLTEVVGNRLRASDQLGRWGGEEFLVLAAHTNADQAMVVAERLRQQVEETEFPVVGQMTVSIGVASWRTGDHRRAVIERADRALYRAKQAGRNQVACEDLPALP